MEDRVIFEDLGIEITDEELELVDKETLIACKKRLEETLEKLMSK